MSTSPRKLPAIPLPGLRPDSLGNYLASLGLLRLLARNWPEVRIAWKDGVLHVVGGPSGLDEMLDTLVNVASEQSWAVYRRDWLDAQTRSTSRKSGTEFAYWQAGADEDALELVAAHVVPGIKLSFNPLLGKGGSAGNRDLSDGWKRAVNSLTAGLEIARHALGDLLAGRPIDWQVDKAPLEPAQKGSKQKRGSLNAACWFSEANKLYNSGQHPYREGSVSPWAMALACEGLPFFAGAASRRLGSRACAVGAFPFVTQAAAPTVSGEAGRDNAEVWAPVWDRPMTLPEVRALFARGRAEVRGRGAVTPAAFATAIVERGVDAGITGFLRFSLGRTTSANTFEPRFEGHLVLPTSEIRNHPVEAGTPLAGTIERILALVDRLPHDEKKGQRWRFAGLRGPIERAMIQLAASPSDPEVACGLLDAVVAALDKVDRNQGYRARQVSWEPLPGEWLPALFGSEAPPPEARLALAAVSGFPSSRPFALYRFGVEWQYGRYVHPKQAPLRWVWGPGELQRVLANVLTRRVLDWEEATKDGPRQEPPARVVLPATRQHVNAWLDGQVDGQFLERWLSRLALFDWRWLPQSVAATVIGRDGGLVPIGGTLAMFGLFQPLFDLQPLSPPGYKDDLLDPESGARTPAAARRVIALIRTGQADAAVALAMSRYAMAKTWLVKTEAPWLIEDPERLLASFLFTIPVRERGLLIQRWLRPQKEKGEIAYA